MEMKSLFSHLLPVANYQRDDRVYIVGNGFTFFGFVFVWGWLFSKGLWKQGLLMLFLYIPIYFFHSVVVASIIDALRFPIFYLLFPSVFLLSMHLYVGIKGNQWLQSSLVNRGYTKI